MKTSLAATLAPLLLALGACQTSPYYAALEAVGVENRELLVDRVSDTRGSIGRAETEMQRLMRVYRETADADPNNIEGAYERLDDAYDDATGRVRGVENDIEAMKQVADDTFAEWERELALYQDAQLRAESAARLEEMRGRYAALERTLDEVQQSLDPVLFAFRDRVLYLKRNMNVATLADMKTQAPGLTEEVRSALAELERAEAATAEFLAAFQS